MLFIPIFLISWFVRKTRYQFDLVMIISGICAYGAYLADLMSKSTPNWGHLRFSVPFIIGFIIVGLLNIISLLNITVMVTKKKILDPLHNAIEQKNEIEKNLLRQKKELTQFAHMMAHDLRSNLTSIKGYSQLLLENYKEKLSNKILSTIRNIFDQSILLENKIINFLDNIKTNGSQYDILLIEDDLATIRLITSYFESKGFSEFLTNIDDNSNEGLIHDTKPIFAVQFHPEASPGPLDSLYLFDKFIELMEL